MAQYLKIHELSGINFSSIPHVDITGDDRGGIAITADNVLVTGEDATGVFAQDLSTSLDTGVVYDGIFSDLATGALFTLATDATTPVVAGDMVITHIIPLDPDDGTPGTAIALTDPIVVSAAGGNGIFVSLGRVVVYSNVDNGAYEIDLTTGTIGTVTDIGHIPRPPMEDSDEGWASWGVAEFFDGVTHLAYVADATAVPDAIMRTAVPSGDTEVIGTFRNIADMASFTVSPEDGRWYFHFEDNGGTQFGATEADGNEFVGFADAIVAADPALAGDGDANSILGTADEDIISGGGGDDSLAGLDGDDALIGDDGNDALDGGDDDDLMLGGAGNDSLVGGSGSDIAVFSGKFLDYRIVGLGDGVYTVEDLRAGSPDGTDTLTGLEALRFFDTNPIPIAELPFISRESEDLAVRTTIPDGVTATAPKAAILEDGRIIDVWESNESGVGIVRGRIFNADGTPDMTFDGGNGAGNDFSINTTSAGGAVPGLTEPDIAILSDGRFVVVWNRDEVHGRIFNADGSPDLSVNGGNDFVINTETSDDQLLPTVAALEDGRFVVAWRSTDTNGADTLGGTIRAVVYGPDGTPDPDVNGGQDFVANSTFDGMQGFPEIVSLADGGFFIVWESSDLSGADASGGAIRGRFFEADGDPDLDLNGGNDFIVNTTFEGTQFRASAVRLTDGRLVVTWSSNDQFGVDDSLFGIRARVFRANGTPDADVNGGDDFLVNTNITVATQALPSVAALPDGGFAIAWTDTSGDGFGNGLRLRIYDGNGDAKGPEVQLNDVIVGNQFESTMATLQDGTLLAIWRSLEDQTGPGDVVRMALVDPTSPASLGGDLVGSVQEDVDLIDTGVVIVIDADPSETEVVAQAGVAGTYGSFSIAAAGNWTYTLNNALPAVQGLLQGAIVFDQFDVESADGSATTLVTVVILGTNEAPTIVGPSAAEQSAVVVDENAIAVADINATDSNTGAVLTYAIAGGADAVKFVIDPGTGVLQFKEAPDFEDPSDKGRDNIYEVVVSVSDAEGGVDSQAVEVVVHDLDGQQLQGSKKPDTLTGGVEEDILIGGGGKDKLFGKGGADYLHGGDRGDKLSGGAGPDVFDYDTIGSSRPGKSDVIVDFDGNDVIDLRGIDARTNDSGNQRFTFIGRDGFSDDAGELRFKFVGKPGHRSTIIEADVNGNSEADLRIELKGRHVLEAEDFVL